MKLFVLGLAVIAATMFGGVAAHAGFVTGGVAFTGTPANDSSGTVLDTRNVTSVTKTGGSLDFSHPGIPNFTTLWGDFTFTNPMPSGGVFSLSNATFGTFTSATLVSDNFDTGIVAGNGSRTIVYSGVFEAGSLFSAGLQDATFANLTLTLSQSTILGVTSFSTTVDMTASGTGPAAVPEPTSIALFGLGALGLVARRFRRK